MPEPKWQRWTALVLLLSAVALLVLALNLPGPVHAGSVTDIRRVVVIHFDSTGAGDLGCYGGIARTPNVDAIAARGMRMNRSITPLPTTPASVASFLTGRLPNRHGVYDAGAVLARELTTLPELLRANGFVTGGFTSNLDIDRAATGQRGFAQGFDEWVGLQDLPDRPEGVHENEMPRAPCKPLIDRAMDFVDQHRHDRFFLWMLHVDPGAPYAPPAPFDTLYLEHRDLVAGDVQLAADRIPEQARVPARTSSREYIARHLGEVSLVDYHLGSLFRQLDELPGRTLLIITSTHGESLGDADCWFLHGANIRHPSINVPLIIACDDLVPVGESDALVASVDLAPTILELLEIGDEDTVRLEADGRSMTGAFASTDPWPQRMVPIQTNDGRPWRGVRSRDYCLQSRLDTATGARIDTLLYHLPTDPAESRDVAAEHADVLEALLGHETAWFTRHPLEPAP